MKPIGGVTALLSIVVIAIHTLVVRVAGALNYSVDEYLRHVMTRRSVVWSTGILSVLIAIFASVSGAVLYLGARQENNNLYLAHNLTFRCPELVMKTGDNAVVLRLDDVQAYGWTRISIQIMHDAIARGFPVTAGVIPVNIETDKRIVRFFADYSCAIELALHGYNNAYGPDTVMRDGEFASIEFEEARAKLIAGSMILRPYLSSPLKVFIPPHNQLSEQATDALVQTGFTIVSSEGDGYHDYDTATFDFWEDTFIPAETVISDCEARFSIGDRVCVIMLHPQDFARTDTSIDPVRYAEYTKILEWLVAGAMPVITMEEAERRRVDESTSTE